MTGRVAVANAKGGVGKTMLSINVAGALDQRDRDVLLVDPKRSGVGARDKAISLACARVEANESDTRSRCAIRRAVGSST